MRLLTALSLFAGAALVSKLYLVQIVAGSEFKEKAERQYMRESETLFDRGTIFFEARDKTLMTAAGLKRGFTVAIHPKDIADADTLVFELQKFLPLEREAVLAKATKPHDPYEEIARRVPPEVAERIADRKLPGVSLYKERWRFYPGGRLAAHLIGFFGWSGDEFSGRYGLERYYEDVLVRGDESLYNNFFAEIFSNVRNVVGKEGRSAGDIVTSIEPSVEYALESTLTELLTAYAAVQAGGIVMNPQDGTVYAMALAPSFDPNEFGKEVSAQVFSNSLVEGVYEMGSILKPVTLAAGLDAGVISATSTYFDAGSLTLSGRTISNFDGKGRGQVSMQEVLNQSLNTGAATVALKLGRERFRDYLRRFGFGEETGIDLPSEAAGLVGNLESGRDIEIVTASYGQGIALTPIQTIRALAALANGGFLVTPHLATKINLRVGVSRSVGGSNRTPILKPETSEEITRMLVEVVDTALLEGKYRQPRHSIAAKTGTALVARSEGGGYYEDRFLHSFFGYFPAYTPRFIVFLYLREPEGVTFASRTLTEPFMKLAKFLINYYEIPPDR